MMVLLQLLFLQFVEDFASEGVSTSFISPNGPSALGKSVLKRKGHAPKGLVTEIVAERPTFPEAPTCSDL